MFLQSLVRFHQGLFKILTKQNVSDTLSFVRTDNRTDNVKTVYPPTNIVCGGYNKLKYRDTVSVKCPFYDFFFFFALAFLDFLLILKFNCLYLPASQLVSQNSMIFP